MMFLTILLFLQLHVNFVVLLLKKGANISFSQVSISTYLVEIFSMIAEGFGIYAQDLATALFPKVIFTTSCTYYCLGFFTVYLK